MGRRKWLAMLQEHLRKKGVQEGKVKDNSSGQRADMKRKRKKLNRKRRKLDKQRKQRSG